MNVKKATHKFESKRMLNWTVGFLIPIGFKITHEKSIEHMRGIQIQIWNRYNVLIPNKYKNDVRQSKSVLFGDRGDSLTLSQSVSHEDKLT